MSKFQIHHTEDFVTLESGKQAISVIGFSLSKMEEGLLTQLSRRITNYFDSFGYSYVIQMTETSMKLYLIISAQNAGEVIDKVSNLLEKMQKITPISPFLVISKISHTSFAEDLHKNYISPIRKTSEPRIVKIGNKFMVFSSISLSNEASIYINKYFQDLLTFKECDLNLSSRVSKKEKNNSHKHNKGILISYSSPMFDNCIEFLQELRIISLQYKEKIAFSIKFHSLNEIKRSKILFLLGLPNKSEIPSNWDSNFKIEKFIPSIRSKSRKLTEPLKSIRKDETVQFNKNRIKFFPLLRRIKLPNLILKKVTRKQEIEEKPTITLTKEQQKLEKATNFNSNIEQNKQENNPIFLYGQVVTEKEIKKLIKNIPPPPP